MTIGLVTCITLPEPDVDEELMLAAFHDAGHAAIMVPWDAPEQPECDRLVLRSCWNYPWHVEEFLTWVESRRCPVLNSPEIVRWNIHKGYLLELEAKGIPIVPSRVVRRGEPAIITETCKIVVKPCISAGSWKTQVFEPGDPAALSFLSELVSERDVLIQPYLPSVEGEGERSLIWLNGNYSHSIRKQVRFAGEDEGVSLAEPDSEQLDFGHRVMAAAPTVLYARVDIMRGPSGQWLLSELELIEPSLFFTQVPSALQHLVAGTVGPLGLG